MEDVVHYGQVVSPELFTTLLLLKKAESLDLAHHINFFTTQEMQKSAIKNILFAECHLSKNFVEKIQILNSAKLEKNNIDIFLDLKEVSKLYHSDCIRIAFLSLADPKNSYNKDIFAKWDIVIAKFRNACRYIKTTFFEKSDSISVEKIIKNLDKNIETFSAFDSWIISKLVVILEDYRQIKSPKQI